MKPIIPAKTRRKELFAGLPVGQSKEVRTLLIISTWSTATPSPTGVAH
jgi:hypothetical protein